jgi:uncharacterized protein YqgQ
MSGGYFEYRQYMIEQIADEIDQLILSNEEEALNDWGQKIGRFFPPEIISKFTEAAATLRKAAAMAQRVDWLVSSDDSPESFMQRWEKEVPK